MHFAEVLPIPTADALKYVVLVYFFLLNYCNYFRNFSVEMSAANDIISKYQESYHAYFSYSVISGFQTRSLVTNELTPMYFVVFQVRR